MSDVLTYAMAYQIISERGLSIYSPTGKYEDKMLAFIAKRLDELYLEQRALMDAIKLNAERKDAR